MMNMLLKSMIAITALVSIVPSAPAEEKAYTIQEAYQSALDKNEIVRIAEEGVLQGEFKVDQAWTYIYPRITAQGAYTRYNERLPEEGNFVVQPLDQVMAALVLTQPLYTGGRTMAALMTAKKMREQNKLGLAAAKQEILLGVTEAYYGVLKAQKFVEIGKKSLERMERHKKVTEEEAATRRTKMNVSTLLRAKTMVSQARINLVRMEDGLKIARKRLNEVSGLPVDAMLSVPQALEASTDGVDALTRTALENRVDIEKVKLAAEMAKENVKIVRGGHYPQVAAEAGLRYVESEPAMMGDATSVYGAVKLQIPIFEGGLMKAEVSEARSKLRQAEMASESLKKAVETDVYSAYVNLQTTSEVLATAKLQLEYAQGNFGAVESLFSQGLVPSINLIDAEQALSLAEREAVNATYDRQVAIVKLKKSIGMLVL